MPDFDYRTLSKIVFPNGDETQYLQYADGRWTASNRDQTCVLTNTCLGYAVASLNAKLRPASGADRDHMIASLREWIRHNEDFLEEYGSLPQWESKVKDARKGISRLEKEILRLESIVFSEGKL